MNRPPLTDLDACPYQWVTPADLAYYLSCDVRTVLRMIALGSLYAYRVGRCWRIPIDEARRRFPVDKPA